MPKMIEDRTLLARKQRIDAERKAAAIARIEGPKRIQRHNNALMLARIAAASKPVSP